MSFAQKQKDKGHASHGPKSGMGQEFVFRGKPYSGLLKPLREQLRVREVQR